MLFSVAPPPIDSVPADSLVGKAVFDLWHYKDQVLQPTQRLNAARDRNKSYSAIYFMSTKKVVQLADDSIPTVNVSEDGRIGVANSRERYMIEQMWGDGGTDVYVIDPVDERAQADQGKDQRQRAALARRQVRRVLRPQELVQLQHGDREDGEPHRRV